MEGAQIVTTCTADKQYATILTDNMVGAGVHINAIGGDCPGKTELHRDILLRSTSSWNTRRRPGSRARSSSSTRSSGDRALAGDPVPRRGGSAAAADHAVRRRSASRSRISARCAGCTGMVYKAPNKILRFS
jgi:hypothetical protein